MLIVRQEQIESVVRRSESDHVNHLLVYVKRRQPTACGDRDDATLCRMIRAGLKRAARYDLERVAETEPFIERMFAVAPNFDEQPAIRAVLEDAALSPAQRIERILSPQITEQDWEQARAGRDERAWQTTGRRSKKT